MYFDLFFSPFGHAAQYVGSWFPNQGSNLYPLKWKHGVFFFLEIKKF